MRMSFRFDPTSYGPTISTLLQQDEPCELGPGTPNRVLADQLQELNANSLSDKPIVDQQMAACCVSSLWLLHNFLGDSHTINQGIRTSTGSYWHAIMHRREPDFPNSKYWFRRVGSHPVFPTLCSAVRETLEGTDLVEAAAFFGTQSEWDPFAFVDLCEAATQGKANVQLCRNVAQLEWRILFDYCYRAAIGE